MATERFYTVDEVLRDKVVLIDDDGRALAVEPDHVPKTVMQGTVLRVHLDRSGEPDWSTCWTDHAETERRKAEDMKRLRQLRRSEPGV